MIRFVIIIIIIATLQASVILTLAAVPRLSITPRGILIEKIGSNVVLTCALTSDDVIFTRTDILRLTESRRVTLRWSSPGRAAVTSVSGRVYTEQSDENILRLHITQIGSSDVGLYSCTATLSDSRELVEETRLVLHEEIRFLETPTSGRHMLGGNALLQCEVTGEPKPEVSWWINRRRILSENGKYAINDKGLTINNLDLRDNGTYECRAEIQKEGQIKSRIVSIDVLYPPVILRPPTADLVIKGHNTSLQCRAVGNPPVRYEWLREQKMSEMIRVKVRIAEGTETYHMTNVDSADEGRYFCRVSNEHGTKEMHVDVHVLVAPEIKSFQHIVTLPERSDFNISCEATGVPLPKISWSRSGSYNTAYSEQHLRKSRIWIENAQPGISSLVIRNLSRNYAGNLSCTAENPVALVQSHVTISVEYAPSVTVDSVQQLGWTDQIRSYTCTAEGLPVPKIYWYHGEQHIATSDDVYSILTSHTNVIRTSTLSITITDGLPDIYGTFSCMAKNVHGRATESIKLIEGLRPNSPRNISVSGVTPTSITLAVTPPWKTDNIPAITHWTIAYEVMGHLTNKSLNFTYGSELAVNDLVPATMYTFYVSASNPVGASPHVIFKVSTLHQETPSTSIDSSQKSTPAGKGFDDNSEFRPDSEINVRLGASSFSNNSIVMLGFIIASILVLVTIMAAIFCCVLRWKRRKPGDGPSERFSRTTATSQNERTSTNCLVTLYSAGNLHSQHTDLTKADDVIMPVGIAPVPYGSIPSAPATLITTPISSSGSNLRLGPSIQQQEWDRMLFAQSNSVDNVATPAPESGMHLLQHTDSSGPSGAVQRFRHAGGADAVAENQLVFDAGQGCRLDRRVFLDKIILDGYISGDNVDDDIDQVDYTIRIPSIHNKMCEISSH